MTYGREGKIERRPDRAALAIAAVLALVAVIIVWSTFNAPQAAGYTVVGPKTVPYIVAACLAGLAIWTAIEGIRGDFPDREGQNHPPMLWLLGGLVLQLLTIKTIGFALAAGIMFAATAKAFGKGPLALTIPIGIIFSFVVWLIFAVGLQLTLPEGPVETAVRALVSG
jgi:putative tricarboxylic transport membrane protein